LAASRAECERLRVEKASYNELHREFESVQKELNESNQCRATLHGELASLAQQFQDFLQEWESGKSTHTSELEIKNAEIRCLMARLKQLMTKYQPLKGDVIDELLAQYVNTFHPPVPFFRLDDGVYLFGTRRVIVRIHNNDKLVFRIGGGFCDFEKFIDQYASEELAKLENRELAASSPAQVRTDGSPKGDLPGPLPPSGAANRRQLRSNTTTGIRLPGFTIRSRGGSAQVTARVTSHTRGEGPMQQ